MTARKAANPAPRPALRKAADAHVHPAVPRSAQSEPASLHGTTADAVRRRAGSAAGTPTARPETGHTAAAPASVPPPRPGAGADPHDLHRRKGAVTSDALRDRPGKGRDKPVDLKVEVPKSVRQAVRDLAKQRRASVDDVVTALLREGLGRTYGR